MSVGGVRQAGGSLVRPAILNGFKQAGRTPDFKTFFKKTPPDLNVPRKGGALMLIVGTCKLFHVRIDDKPFDRVDPFN